MTELNDGLKNVVANLGTQRDKLASNQFVFCEKTDAELIEAYRGSWIPRAVVDIPAEDATRKWREWKAEPDQITALEALEKELGVNRKVEQAMKMARLLGGAAIYIATGDADPSRPLGPERVRQIRGLPVLTKLDLTPDEIIRDIESPYYGKAEFYKLARRDGQPEVHIHASRLAVFEGNPKPDAFGYVGYRDAPLSGIGHTSWSDSVLQSAFEAISQHDSSAANIASLIFEAKVDVLRFEGFADLLTCAGGDAQAINRLTLQAAMKGINGALVMDAKDEYEAKSASFGGLNDLMERFGNLVSGATGIPLTRLFGRSAAGLSGSGDGDERVYFDRINREQTNSIEPALKMLDECLIRIAIGSRPPEVWYEWKPLRQISEKERADIFKTTADAARAIAGTAAGELIPIPALSDALVNELIEQAVLPGLESAIEEYGPLGEEEDGEDLEVVAVPEEE